MIVNIENLFKIFKKKDDIKKYINERTELKIFVLNNKLENAEDSNKEEIRKELDRLNKEFLKEITSRYNN
ncbi:hypothetical protein QTH30_14655 [Clostridium perfringens]|uniref:hypothetical protein n=1 Tax=Clostridium perfringens TaxID=1502 RepID=UPI0013E3A109|nr:hypothetical protein [Clostridium perfringens]ELC8390951.1 hypothetical protein [Clostridium perfringens]MDH5087410.1 hypothetical protein [Clostridium perfringens]MDK0637122.1 hypothetical protein [Clostridium perfringens]MDM0520014.1 hypothetical protein [Clostridium perfringens]MDM0657398.1 hypothetical protein [Clostridium perfringens]